MLQLALFTLLVVKGMIILPFFPNGYRKCSFWGFLCINFHDIFHDILFGSSLKVHAYDSLCENAYEYRKGCQRNNPCLILKIIVLYEIEVVK